MRSGALLKATCALAVGASGYSLPAAAAELSLAEPAACTSRDELVFVVERRLGHSLAEAGGQRFVAHVQTASRGFAARLDVSGEDGAASGQRSLAEATCDDLVQALALAIALAVGSRPDAAESATPRAPSTDPGSLPSTEPGPGEAPRPTSSEAAEHALDEVGPTLDTPESGPGFAALTWMVADTGSLPAAGLGVAAGAELAWSGFSLRVVGLLLPGKEGSVDPTDPASPGADIGLASGSLLGCLPIATGQRKIQLDACGGWEVGQLSGQGTGVQNPHRNGTLWSAARLDLSGRWVLLESGLGVELLVSAAAPLTRDEFVLKDIGSVYRPANVVGRAGLGLSWNLDGGSSAD